MNLPDSIVEAARRPEPAPKLERLEGLVTEATRNHAIIR